MRFIAAEFYHMTLLKRFVEAVESIAHSQRRIAHCVCREHPHFSSFEILQIEGAHLTMITGVVPSVLSQFVATPIDSTGVPIPMPVGVTPVWSSSDTTNAPLGLDGGDPSGLTVEITPPASAPTTGFFSLSVTVTLASGTVVSQSVSIPFLPPPAPVLAGFQINQTV